MKKKVKKLTLSKETLRNLDARTLSGAKGEGLPPDYTMPSVAPTCTTCWSLGCFPTRGC